MSYCKPVSMTIGEKIVLTVEIDGVEHKTEITQEESNRINGVPRGKLQEEVRKIWNDHVSRGEILE